MADRLKIERTGDVQLIMMIPVDQLPGRVKDVLKGVKATVGNLYRNREVFDKTGFWFGKDNKWRYELDDSEMVIKPKSLATVIKGYIIPLPGIIEHPTLYKVIPELKNVIMKINENLGSEGIFHPEQRLIEIKHLNKDTIIHEVQHAVNDIVGSKFKGSSPVIESSIIASKLYSGLIKYVKDPTALQFIDEMYQRYLTDPISSAQHLSKKLKKSGIKSEIKAADAIDKVLNELGEERGFEKYMKDPGEMESRLAEARMNMTAEQRKAEPPWETLDKMLMEEIDVKFPDTDVEALKIMDNAVKDGTKLYSGIDPTRAKEILGPFFSKLSKVVTEKMGGKGDISQIKSMLKNQGVTDAEINNLIGGLKGKVTKQEVMDEIKANSTEFRDVILGEQALSREGISDAEYNTRLANRNYEGSTKFESYQEPGAVEGSYREMFVTAPKGEFDPVKTESAKQDMYESMFDGTTKEFDAYRSGWEDGHAQYSDIQNPIVRIRFNEHSVESKRVLFIEEMQGPSEANQAKMPDYLRNRIYNIGVKRTIAYAKENGFDEVAWTKGKTQADRYNLNKQVTEIDVYKDNEGLFHIEGLPVGEDDFVPIRGFLKQEQLAEHIGKTAA